MYLYGTAQRLIITGCPYFLNFALNILLHSFIFSLLLSQIWIEYIKAKINLDFTCYAMQESIPYV